MSCAPKPAPTARPWRVKLTSFMGFAGLFFTSAAGLVSSLFVLTSDEPYFVDGDVALKQLHPSQPDITLRAYLLDQGFDNFDLFHEFFVVVYHLLFTFVGIGSVLIFLIVFFGHSSRVLIGGSQIAVSLLVILLRSVFANTIGAIWLSRYNRLLDVILAANLIGFVSYSVFGNVGDGDGQQKRTHVESDSADVSDSVSDDQKVRAKSRSKGKEKKK